MQNNKKILIGVAVNGTGVIDNYISSFVKVASKAGFSCDVLTTDYSNKYADKLKENGCRLIVISNLKNKKEIKSKIKELNEKNKYWASYWNISTAIMYPYVKAAWDCGIKTNIVHSHAHYNSQPNAIKTFIFDRLHFYYRSKMQKLDLKYAACSTDCARWIAGDDVVNKNQWTFVPNPIDVEKCTFNQNKRDEYRENLNINDKFVVGCVTSFMPYKNPLFLIDIFKEILEINPDSYLLLAGTGPMEDELKKHAEEILPQNKYNLLGHRDDVTNLLQAFDCFVLPSLNEGLPLCVLEAQAADLPCLTSTSITDEVIVLKDKFAQCSFESGAKSWAETAINLYKKNTSRSTDAAKKVSASGFNLNSPQKALELF